MRNERSAWFWLRWSRFCACPLCRLVVSVRVLRHPVRALGRPCAPADPGLKPRNLGLLGVCQTGPSTKPGLKAGRRGTF